MMNKYMYDFQVQSCKSAIERKILEQVLEFYDSTVTRIKLDDKERLGFMNQKKYRVLYTPKGKMFYMNFPMVSYDFIIDDPIGPDGGRVREVSDYNDI